MKFVLEQISGPEIEPVTTAELKVHLGEFSDLTERDDQMDNLIASARRWVEKYTGRVLVDQTWRLTIAPGGMNADEVSTYRPTTYFSGVYEWKRVGEIMLRRSPALAVAAFATVDADGVETAISASHYELREPDSKWPRVVALTGATWATALNLRLTFRAGYADRTGSPITGAEAVPEVFRQAIMLHAEAHYDRDPKTMEMLLKAAKALIQDERIHSGLA